MTNTIPTVHLPPRARILVIGGGITGLSAAIEAAEAGCDVVLVERKPYLGGRVAQMYQYFPKLCPPVCGLEINLRRMRTSPRIQTFTLAEVDTVTGGPGTYRVVIRQQPRFVAERCSGCGKCADVCTAERPSEFDFGMKRSKAAYLAYPGAWPTQYTVDPRFCLGTPRPDPLPTPRGEEEKIRPPHPAQGEVLRPPRPAQRGEGGGEGLRLPRPAQRGEGRGEGLPCTKCAEVCPTKAIDLIQQPRTFGLDVQAVIWATGWEPYQPTRLTDLGFGAHPDVITNMMMERLASPTGPTNGRIVRLSNDQAPTSVAFVQCAGSRDDAHLGYCSGLCCMATAKHARYVRSQHPDADIFIYYIDRRASGRQETFLTETERDEKVHFVPGKVARVSVDADSPVVEVEDTSKGSKLKHKVDLVVLATGVVPVQTNASLLADRYGFLSREQPSKGQLTAGCARGPMDVATAVRDATSAVLRALEQCRVGAGGEP
ncbi:MAG TPA: FAD-dependent oxidoreductase [Polyangia bacterium]